MDILVYADKGVFCHLSWMNVSLVNLSSGLWKPETRPSQQIEKGSKIDLTWHPALSRLALRAKLLFKNKNENHSAWLEDSVCVLVSLWILGLPKQISCVFVPRTLAECYVWLFLPCEFGRHVERHKGGNLKRVSASKFKVSCFQVTIWSSWESVQTSVVATAERKN